MTGRKRFLFVVGVVIAVIVGAAGVWAALRAGTDAAELPAKLDAPQESAQSSELDLGAGPGLGSIDGYQAMAEENAAVKPAVADYTVKADLSNIANLKVFKSVLEPGFVKMLVKNKFAVTPSDEIQMFYIYENNEYQRPQKMPSFITTDSMLHMYHVFYDYTLREVESYKLYDTAVKLTDMMLKASQEDYANAKDQRVKDAARRNVAYFALARTLLGGAAAPADVKDLVDTDLAQIKGHVGNSQSAILGLPVGFSQFVPRGHYTRTEKLKKYFNGLMWYGLAPFAIPRKDFPRVTPTVQALMIVRNLRTLPNALTLWNTIYEPTAFYVGTADDYTVYDYSKLMDSIYGKNPGIEAFGDAAKLNTFVEAVQKLRAPGIAVFDQGREFRFMGQRFIPDSRVSQVIGDALCSNELSGPIDPRWPEDPSGLDVMASMGSERALAIRKTFDKLASHPRYMPRMQEMRKEMLATHQSTWQSNLYYGWLWSLQSINKPAQAGYPSFMRNEAWLDKSLMTAMGSWTELRHDTILYAKQSSSAECGGDSEEPPATPKGYVEPNLEFWTKLKWLNRYTMDGLSRRGLLTGELEGKFTMLDEWLTFCRNITIKELTNKKVTEEEYREIEMYGAEMETLTLMLADGDLTSDTDKDMAIVADVHTRVPYCLEEGTGRAAAIYVVVPIEGKLYLTRGAVYTHYEFIWPMSDRLTDEAWQKMLNSGKHPAMAPWTKSFFLPTKKRPADGVSVEYGGC